MKHRIHSGIRPFRLFIVLVLFFFSSNKMLNAQSSKEISLSAYSGFTMVNFEKALGYSDDNMEDWSEIHFSGVLRGFVLSGRAVDFGAEAAWQNLYYAYYRIPYGPSPVYREFSVSTVSIMALGRYTVSGLFCVAGAGIHIFDDGVSPSLCFEAGYRLRQASKLSFPVSLRINPVFGKGTPVLFSAGAGVSYIIDK